MRKVLPLKEKRSWWRLLLPTAMADTATEAHLLKSLETAAAAPEAPAATVVSRRQGLKEITVSRRQNLASDELPPKCRWSISSGTSTAINKKRDNSAILVALEHLQRHINGNKQEKRQFRH